MYNVTNTRSSVHTSIINLLMKFTLRPKWEKKIYLFKIFNPIQHLQFKKKTDSQMNSYK